MKRTASIFCFSAVSLIALLSFAAAKGKDNPEKRRSPRKTKITVAEIHQAEVIGRLGVPLGQVVTIEGIVADEDYIRTKANSGHRLLRVLKLDGRRLKEEVVFRFPKLSPLDEERVKEPKVGARFAYICYENGGFSGIPGAAFKHIGTVQTAPYGFSTWLEILKDNGVATKLLSTGPMLAFESQPHHTHDP